MTGFYALQSHEPFLTLLVGLIVFMGMLGIGLLIVDRFKLPSPWRIVVASLLGIQIFSLGVQGIAIAQIASQLILICYAIIYTVMGLASLFFHIRNTPLKLDCSGFQFRWFWVVYLGMILTLIMAMHGSTKMDEMHYHMLLPARVVSDGGLHFYQLPWQGAILPQMTYQLSMAPFHAMGFIHVGNIISWLLAILMLWAAATLVWEASKSAGWTALTVSSIAVGMYPMIWHVTSGAHALGDISVVFTIIALVQFESLRKRIGRGPIILLISFLAVSAATTKLSILPLSGLTLLFLVIKSFSFSSRFVFLSLVPWILFYFPIFLWTWTESGSPFGPAFAEILGSRSYDPIEIKETIENTKAMSRRSLSNGLLTALFSFSPLIWIFTIKLFVSNELPRLFPAFFFSLQCILIASLLPYDFRFLSGTQFAATILFGIYGYSQVTWLTKSTNMLRAVLLLGTLPWVAFQCIYVAPFVKYLTGITPTSSFNARYIAFYKDYLILDSILPKNAALLAEDVHINSIYAPRPVFFSEADLPSSQPNFRFQVIDIRDKPDKSIIYQNKSSIIATTRVPGRTNKSGRLIVSAISKNR